MSGGPSGPDWYLPRQDGPDARAIQGRHAFLKALGRLRPQSLTDLLDTVRPMADPIPDHLLSSLAPLESASSNIARVWEELHEIPDSVVEGWVAGAEQVAEGIRRWGKRWNLRDHWLHDAALGPLQAHRRGERRFGLNLFSRSTRWTHHAPTPPGGSWGPLDPIVWRTWEAEQELSGLSMGEILIKLSQEDPPDTLPEFHPWDPLSQEGEKDARDRFLAAFRPYVEAHLRDMRRWVEEIGAKPMPERKPRGKRPAEAPYEWLVRWQVPRTETHAEIARTVKRAQKTVQRAVGRTAHEIGLTRRSMFTRGARG